MSRWWVNQAKYGQKDERRDMDWMFHVTPHTANIKSAIPTAILIDGDAQA